MYRCENHFDNLDHAGRAMLPSADTAFTTNAGSGRLGGNALGLAPFETCVLAGKNSKRLFVTAPPARHGPVGIEPYSGDVVGFASGVDQPGDLIYITIDSSSNKHRGEFCKGFACSFQEKE